MQTTHVSSQLHLSLCPPPTVFVFLCSIVDPALWIQDLISCCRSPQEQALPKNIAMQQLVGKRAEKGELYVEQLSSVAVQVFVCTCVCVCVCVCVCSYLIFLIIRFSELILVMQQPNCENLPFSCPFLIPYPPSLLSPLISLLSSLSFLLKATSFDESNEANFCVARFASQIPNYCELNRQFTLAPCFQCKIIIYFHTHDINISLSLTLSLSPCVSVRCCLFFCSPTLSLYFVYLLN